MNEAAVNVAVPAWWTDMAFLLGVYLSMSTDSDRLKPEGLPQSKLLRSPALLSKPGGL